MQEHLRALFHNSDPSLTKVNNCQNKIFIYKIRNLLITTPIYLIQSGNHQDALLQTNAAAKPTFVSEILKAYNINGTQCDSDVIHQ